MAKGSLTKRKNILTRFPMEGEAYNMKEHITLNSKTSIRNAKKEKYWFRNLKCRPLLGFSYIIMSCVCFTLLSVIIKKLDNISPGQLCIVRSAGVFVFNLPMLVFSMKNILGPKEDRWTICIRSILGTTAFYLNMLSYRYLPLAEVSIIMSTVPTFVSVIARIYLKEPCGIVQSMAVLLTMFGVLLSIRLPELLKNSSGEMKETMRITGLLCAFGYVFTMTAAIIFMRKLRYVHFSVIQMYLSVLGTLQNTILTATMSSFTAPFCNGWDSIQMLLTAVLGFLGIHFLTLAMLSESAGVVTVVKASLDIILSMIFQITFFGLIPDAYNIIGSVLVIVSVAIITLRKLVFSLTAENEKRKKLRYLLM